PIPGLLALAWSGGHGANHAPIGFGHHLGGSLGGQGSKRLRIFLLQDLLGPLGVLQGRLTHRTGADGKTVMFQHPCRPVPKRMPAAKIGQPPLQTPGASPRADSDPARQQTLIALLRCLPDPFPHAHHSKHAPPLQRFFLRTTAPAFFCLNSWPNFRSTSSPQPCIVTLPNRRISSISNASTSS